MDDVYELWLFGLFLIKALFSALAGGVIMGALDALSHFLWNGNVTKKQYLWALGASFVFGLFVQWQSTYQEMEQLKKPQPAVVDEASRKTIDDLRIKLFEKEGELQEARRLRDRAEDVMAHTQKENSALMNQSGKLERSKVIPYLGLSHPPILSQDGADLLFTYSLKNSGTALATITETTLSVFLDKKLHFTDLDHLPKKYTIIPSQLAKSKGKIPSISLQDVIDGKINLTIVVDIKYTGMIDDKHSLCLRSAFDKDRKRFDWTPFVDIRCDESL